MCWYVHKYAYNLGLMGDARQCSDALPRYEQRYSLCRFVVSIKKTLNIHTNFNEEEHNSRDTR